jgi:hypothetical protein
MICKIIRPPKVFGPSSACWRDRTVTNKFHNLWDSYPLAVKPVDNQLQEVGSLRSQHDFAEWSEESI